MAVIDKMFGNLDSLTIEEIEELQSRLDAVKSSRVNAEDVKGLLTVNGKAVACPHCGQTEVVRFGKKDGKQRYKCKDKLCGKTFMLTTNTMFTHTRLTREQWLELLRGMVEGLSINKIADNIGMSGKAVWYNEKKVMSVLMKVFGEQDDFIDIAECDEYSVHLSFKGKRDPAFFIYKLGRFPRHNYTYAEKVEYLKKAGFWEDLQKDPKALEQLLHGDCYLAGTNRDSVCILTCKDRSGNLFAKPVCVGTMERYHLNKHMDNRFADDAILVTDCNNTYDWFAAYRSIHHEQVLASKHANGPYNLARINAIHSNLTAFWSDDKENLPATKYLEYDIMLFWWLEKNKDLTTKQLVEELYALICNLIKDPITYQELKNRKMDLDTKGIIPVQV